MITIENINTIKRWVRDEMAHEAVTMPEIWNSWLPVKFPEMREDALRAAERKRVAKRVDKESSLPVKGSCRNYKKLPSHTTGQDR